MESNLLVSCMPGPASPVEDPRGPVRPDTGGHPRGPGHVHRAGPGQERTHAHTEQAAGRE